MVIKRNCYKAAAAFMLGLFFMSAASVATMPAAYAENILQLTDLTEEQLESEYNSKKNEVESIYSSVTAQDLEMTAQYNTMNGKQHKLSTLSAPISKCSVKVNNGLAINSEGTLPGYTSIGVLDFNLNGTAIGSLNVIKHYLSGGKTNGSGTAQLYVYKTDSTVSSSASITGGSHRILFQKN